jgi:hypothetical protein
MEDTIKCELCGMVCSMQISASHLRAVHKLTTKEYKKLGYKTLSPARLSQLQNSPVGRGEEKGNRGKYGAEHWNWKGGYISPAGYRIISRKGKSLLYEHRVVAEEMLGRPLEHDEVVHHIDGNRSNNSPDNLVVMKRKEHDKMKEGIRQYFHTCPECIDAAQTLRSLGWSINKIGKALRVHHDTLKKWLEDQSPT